MEQPTPYRCSRHNKLTGEGPGYRYCLAEGKDEVVPVGTKPASAEPKAKPKAFSSRWAVYGQRGGRSGGIKASPAKIAAAKVNGARGGRPRKAGGL